MGNEQGPYTKRMRVLSLFYFKFWHVKNQWSTSLKYGYSAQCMSLGNGYSVQSLSLKIYKLEVLHSSHAKNTNMRSNMLWVSRIGQSNHFSMMTSTNFEDEIRIFQYCDHFECDPGLISAFYVLMISSLFVIVVMLA